MTIPAGFKPLLAETLEYAGQINYPVYASPKYDGIRCVWFRGSGPFTRNLKPIPNNHLRDLLNETLEASPWDFVDGELLSGGNFQDTTSAIMSHHGVSNVRYTIFDCLVPGLNFRTPYHERLQALQGHNWILMNLTIDATTQYLMHQESEVVEFEQILLNQNYEGVIVRSVDGPYKFGRSTLKQGILLKLKRFVDDEAWVIGFEPEYENTNPLERNALGYAERSTCQENKIAKERLGSLIVENGMGVFSIGGGPGMTHSLRSELWQVRETLKGRIVKFKYFPHGVKDVPRFPQFLGFRDPRDL